MYRNADFQDLILNAIETVLAWDLPDECITDAVNDQARLLAGISPDRPDDACLH
jgi:hypothetical protein